MHAATATVRPKARARGAVALPGTVGHLAVEVVARLVAKVGAPVRPGLREALVLRLCDVALSPDPLAFERMKIDLRRARISGAALADGYIPEVARRVGRDWETDALSFAGVTIAVARLQAMLRDVGAGWAADAAGSRGAGSGGAAHAGVGPQRARGGDAARSVLMILPAGEQHSLGALVVTGQLRRMGVSVCLRLAPTDAELRRLLTERGFDVAMLSIAGEERIAPAARVVRVLAEMTGGRLRMAVGGWLATQVPDLARLTGAAIATTDVLAALSAPRCDAEPASVAGGSQEHLFHPTVPEDGIAARAG